MNGINEFVYTSVVETLPGRDDESPLALAAAAELHTLLRELQRGLSGRAEFAIWLRYSSDRTYAEIGAILGISEEGARIFDVRIRRNLRTGLRARGIHRLSDVL